MTDELKFDPVENPRHYVCAAAVVEPIELLRHAPFDLGCAMKYILRADFKGNRVEDMKKALWYLKCAEESSEYDHEPYRIFFDRYGTLFRAFFPSIKNEDGYGTIAINFTEAVRGLRIYAQEQIAIYSRRGDANDQGSDSL